MAFTKLNAVLTTDSGVQSDTWISGTFTVFSSGGAFRSFASGGDFRLCFSDAGGLFHEDASTCEPADELPRARFARFQEPVDGLTRW